MVSLPPPIRGACRNRKRRRSGSRLSRRASTRRIRSYPGSRCWPWRDFSDAHPAGPFVRRGGGQADDGLPRHRHRGGIYRPCWGLLPRLGRGRRLRCADLSRAGTEVRSRTRRICCSPSCPPNIWETPCSARSMTPPSQVPPWRRCPPWTRRSPAGVRAGAGRRWAVVGWWFGDGPDQPPTLIDVGTPFVRRDGVHQLQPRIMLAAVPGSGPGTSGGRRGEVHG